MNVRLAVLDLMEDDQWRTAKDIQQALSPSPRISGIYAATKTLVRDGLLVEHAIYRQRGGILIYRKTEVKVVGLLSVDT